MFSSERRNDGYNINHDIAQQNNIIKYSGRRTGAAQTLSLPTGPELEQVVRVRAEVAQLCHLYVVLERDLVWKSSEVYLWPDCGTIVFGLLCKSVRN